MAEQLANNDARLTALSDDLARSILKIRESQVHPDGTVGGDDPAIASMAGAPQSAMVDEIKRQLQSEMGLMPVRLLRERRASFVELNSVDNLGKTGYGTAGYLGKGYFITVKHAVVALDEGEDGPDRKVTSFKIRYKGKDLPAQLVDAGDASVEVHSGDWAIIKVDEEIDLPALRIDTELRLRVRRADLPPRQRLLEGHHRRHRLRRAAHAERTGDVPHRRPSRRVRRRRAQSERRPGRHSHRPDGGRLSLLVHPAAARRDVPQGAGGGRRATRRVGKRVQEFKVQEFKV